MAVFKKVKQYNTPFYELCIVHAINVNCNVYSESILEAVPHFFRT